MLTHAEIRKLADGAVREYEELLRTEGHGKKLEDVIAVAIHKALGAQRECTRDRWGEFARIVGKHGYVAIGAFVDAGEQFWTIGAIDDDSDCTEQIGCGPTADAALDDALARDRKGA